MDATDAVLAELLARLDLVVFERLPGDVFVRFGPARPPSWFSRLLLTSRDEAMTIEQTMPFLGQFLAEANEAWRAGGEKRLCSDPFTVTDMAGAEVPLVASAVVVANRCFLVLESPHDFEERRGTLQSARENAIAHEEHLRRTRALLPSIDAAQKLLHELTASGVAPEPQSLTVRISEQLAALRAAVEQLAPLPKGVSRSVRR
jgi:hypothetical protein